MPFGMNHACSADVAKNSTASGNRRGVVKFPKLVAGWEACKDREAPAYSTVTLLARFLGWSTSQPRRRAMW